LAGALQIDRGQAADVVGLSPLIRWAIRGDQQDYCDVSLVLGWQRPTHLAPVAGLGGVPLQLIRPGVAKDIAISGCLRPQPTVCVSVHSWRATPTSCPLPADGARQIPPGDS
jgi:hypothetical protein